MLNSTQKLEVLANLSIELNHIADLDILMQRILTEARRFVNANAGSIYIREDDRLLFSYTQNAAIEARLSIGSKLIYSTFSVPIDENSLAGYAATTSQMLCIEDVYDIDPTLPYHFDKRFDEATGYRSKSMMTVPLVTLRGDVIGVFQIINAQDESGEIISFCREDEKMMAHFGNTATMALQRARMTRAMILRMIRMAEMRDPKETGAHVNRVGAYSVELFEYLAKKHGMAEKEIDAKKDVLRMAAMMHDVGKVAVPDAILKKPGRFTPEEFEAMKVHTYRGARLFRDKQSEFDDAAAEVALNHHEKWNGAGYPGHVDVATGLPLEGYANSDGSARGKVSEEIPLFGRIVAITDVYDALVSKRVYKPAWKEEDALKVLEEGSGSHFDPELVEYFFSCLDIVRSIRDRYPDEVETGDENAPVPPESH